MIKQNLETLKQNLFLLYCEQRQLQSKWNWEHSGRQLDSQSEDRGFESRQERKNKKRL
jgi:hypothetical protein